MCFLIDSLSTIDISPIASSTAETKPDVTCSPSILVMRLSKIELAYDLERLLLDLTKVLISFAASSFSFISLLYSS